MALANPLYTLNFAGWRDTLTLNNGLTVSGSQGQFLLTDGSTISLAANQALALTNLNGGSTWSRGNIIGDSIAAFDVYGSVLGIQSTAGALGVNMNIGKTVGLDSNNGVVDLAQMSANLRLTGTNNYISVGDGGFLNLNETITVNGLQNTEGGIAFGGTHTGTLAVQVNPGGELYRAGNPQQGIPNQVSIAGSVYNTGGTVEVGALGNMLNITGKDNMGRSYWQNTGASAVLQVDNAGNINAAGTYQIDTGKVQLTAPSNANPDELDGAGLIFGNANPTTFKIVDAYGQPGNVSVQGPVTLAANTTTQMNYFGMNNSSDLLTVTNGALTLNGTLQLTGPPMGPRPTQPLTFFFDTGNNPSITGAFTTINDTNGDNNDSGEVLENQNGDTYEVTFAP